MAPTRELAMQTSKEAKKFGRVLNLRVVCVYGGAGISEQIAELKRGAEVVVCTPGRMIDMLAANNGVLMIVFTLNMFNLQVKSRIFVVSHILYWTKPIACSIWDSNRK